MIRDEVKKFSDWITAPLNTQLPLWKLGVLFIVLIIIAFVVYDNVNILQSKVVKL